MSVDLIARQTARITTLRECGATCEQTLLDPAHPDDPGQQAAENPQSAPPASKRRLGLGQMPLAAATLVLVVITAWAIVPGWFSTHDPIKGVPADKLKPPSAAYWFGTDHIGRDLFARVVHGTELTLTAAIIAIVISLFIGALLGLVAGFFGGRLDALIMRTMDVLLAIPGLLLSLAIITALGFGTVKVAIAVGIAGIAAFARVMRGQVLKVRHATYVEAAELAGVSRLAILTRHVLPNAAAPVLVLAAVEFGAVILSVSALSFLGFGATPPDPEWGSLISEGRNYLSGAWWYSTVPGLVILIFVLSVNVVGRALKNREKLS